MFSSSITNSQNFQHPIAQKPSKAFIRNMPNAVISGQNSPKIHGFDEINAKQIGSERIIAKLLAVLGKLGLDLPPVSTSSKHTLNSDLQNRFPQHVYLRNPDTSSPDIDRFLAQLSDMIAREQNPIRRQALFAAAQEGIRQGVVEAKETLNSMGLLSIPLDQAITDMGDSLLDSLMNVQSASVLFSPVATDSDASELDSPAPDRQGSPSEAVDMQAMLATDRQYSEQVGNFQITTKEGDVVTLQFSDRRQTMSMAYGDQQNDTTTAVLAYQSTTSRQLSYHINGELNEEERGAIQKVVDGIEKIASRFFNGDTQAAFAEADKMSLNSDQLAGFTLNLRSVTVQRVVAAYQRVGNEQTANGVQSESGQSASVDASDVAEPTRTGSIDAAVQAIDAIKSLVDGVSTIDLFNDPSQVVKDMFKASTEVLTHHKDHLFGTDHFNGILDALQNHIKQNSHIENNN